MTDKINKSRKKIKQMILAYTGLSLAVFFWAVNTVIARKFVFEIRPMALSFYRWLTAFAIIMPFAMAHLKRDWKNIRQNLGFLSILSIPSVAAYNSVLYLGAQYTTATNISLVVAAMPVMTLFFSWMINRENPKPMESFAIAVSICGMLVIIARGSLQVLSDMSFNPGDLLIVLSVASWALYSVLLKKKEIHISPISFLTVLIGFGTLCIFPFYLWELNVFKGFDVKLDTIYVFLYLGIFPSVLSYIFWNYGVKKAGPAIASIFMYLLPVFTSIIACIFLNEKIFLYHLAGGALIFTGLMMSVYQSLNNAS